MSGRKKQKKQRSLAAKTVSLVVTGCILLSAVSLAIGLAVYGASLSRQYIDLTVNTAHQAATSATHGADSIGFSKEVMRIYKSLSEEERAMTGTPEYREFYSGLPMEKGGTYDVLVHMLGMYLEYNDVYDVYLAMYDRDTCSLVYIVDPDPEETLLPGEWEKVREKEVQRFLEWDGTGQLYIFDRTPKYGWICTAGVPVIDKETGETTVFLLVDVMVGEVISKLIGFVVRICLALLALTILITWVLTRRMKRMVVNPVNAIAQAAEGYVQDKRAGKTVTDRFKSLNIQTNDEVENLSHVMAGMEQDLAEYETQLTQVIAEKERIGTELSLATRIQAAMLPHIFPPFPGRREFDIFASMDPAKEVAGDFYDFFLIDEDHLGLVIADVSGKGVPAALFMTIMKVILQNSAMLGQSAEQILNKANEAICSNNPEGMFVTVWVGILEISSGVLTASNAGHEYPAVCREGGTFELMKDPHGAAIGGFDDETYEAYTIHMKPGDKIFLYTDGVPEACRTDRQMFGTDRMVEALNEAPDASCREILQHIRSAVDTFAEDAEQFDDLTMMCMEYLGA